LNVTKVTSRYSATWDWKLFHIIKDPTTDGPLPKMKILNSLLKAYTIKPLCCKTGSKDKDKEAAMVCTLLVYINLSAWRLSKLAGVMQMESICVSISMHIDVYCYHFTDNIVCSDFLMLVTAYSCSVDSYARFQYMDMKIHIFRVWTLISATV
jgi:hypothetical protein